MKKPRNINKAPVGEPGDTHAFLSLWEAPGGILVYIGWSNSPRAAAAIAATAMAETGLNDRAEYICTVKFSAKLLAEAKSKIELGKPPSDEKGDTNSYLVLEVRGDGGARLHFPHSISCVAASETVKKAMSNSAALYTVRLAAPMLKAVKSLIDSGKCGLVVFGAPDVAPTRTHPRVSR